MGEEEPALVSHTQAFHPRVYLAALKQKESLGGFARETGYHIYRMLIVCAIVSV